MNVSAAEPLPQSITTVNVSYVPWSAIVPLNVVLWSSSIAVADRTPQSPPEDPGTALAQADALRDALREAAGKANHLIQTLKREKKQSRLLKSTLASLREIQKL